MSTNRSCFGQVRPEARVQVCWVPAAYNEDREQRAHAPSDHTGREGPLCIRL
jgi:hypothetical protein